LQSHAIKALSAGKYLNVVRGGGGDIVFNRPTSSSSSSQSPSSDALEVAYFLDPDGQEPLEFTLEISDSPLSKAIEAAYVFSSNGKRRLAVRSLHTDVI
jgi:hypothetical protein